VSDVGEQPASGYLTADERAALGRAARAEVPRSSHAEWEPPADRADPVDVQEQAGVERVPELLPIRYGRMLSSPFAFYRGAAEVMAADLADTPRSGFRVQLCGDAHLSNFGAFASPERDLVFDINDFDETHPGPWEWDVKRLAASLAVAARERDFRRRESRGIVRAAVRRYREAMRDFAAKPNLDVWYARTDVAAVMSDVRSKLSAKEMRKVELNAAKARSKDSLRALSKLTHVVEGEPRIVSDPPIVVPVAELLEDVEAEQLQERMRKLLHEYRDSLPPDRRRLLEGYRFVDMARKVVGVGSVGTRVWVILMAGRDGGDPLFLQCKEAGPSALEAFTSPSEFDNHGERVVQGQRLMQASSDILLGWLGTTGFDGRARDFYVRQLWDWKQSADVDGMGPDALQLYGALCAWTLARAHARSGDRIAIAAYLGKGDVFDRAIGDFAERYADQNEADYSALIEASRSGRIEVAAGL
jgi:uncharacterized protein (DUF2252 family)